MSYHSPITAPAQGRATALSPRDADEHTVSLWYIQARLGRRDYSDGRMVSYIKALVAELGFPKPMPSMRGGKLTSDVLARSRWLRPAVDAWLDNFLPPEAAAAADAAALAQAAGEMDDAARNLGTLRVVGGSQA